MCTYIYICVYIDICEYENNKYICLCVCMIRSC